MTTATLTMEAPTKLAESAEERALPQLRGHLPALDGLRGLAIAMVMICHFVPPHDLPTSRAGRLFQFVAQQGWCGVDLFFVLSGFLITGILLDSKGTAHFFRNFYARRTLRIFPLYYFVLAVIFLVVPLIWRGAFASPALAAIRHRQGWLWTYGTNIAMSRHGEFDQLFHADWLNFNPFWSLAVEEHFYLVWPAIVFLCSQKGLKRICYGCFAGSFLLRGALALLGSQEWTTAYVLTPCRVDVLAAGGLLAVWMREGPASAARILSRAKWFALVLGITCALSIWKSPEREGLFGMTVGYGAVGAFFAALLLAVVGAPATGPLGWCFHRGLLRAMGKYSYGLYVYHVLLGSTFDRLFGREILKEFFARRLHLGGASYGLSVVVFIALASVAAFAVAWTSWHLFEKRFLKLKKYFEYRGQKGLPTAG
jgi:peptidoglycan/LPS O-acetylase OafA/YrhL